MPLNQCWPTSMVPNSIIGKTPRYQKSDHRHLVRHLITRSCKTSKQWDMVQNCLITLLFERCLTSNTAKTPVKFSRASVNLMPKLMALRLHWDLLSEYRPSLGVWVTDLIFSIPLFSQCFIIVKTLVIYWISFSHSLASPQLSCNDTWPKWRWFKWIFLRYRHVVVMLCNVWLAESSRAPALWRHDNDVGDQNMVVLPCLWKKIRHQNTMLMKWKVCKFKDEDLKILGR